MNATNWIDVRGELAHARARKELALSASAFSTFGNSLFFQLCRNEGKRGKAERKGSPSKREILDPAIFYPFAVRASSSVLTSEKM